MRSWWRAEPHDCQPFLDIPGAACIVCGEDTPEPCTITAEAVSAGTRRLVNDVAGDRSNY